MNWFSCPEKIIEYARKGDVRLKEAEAIAATAPKGAGQAVGITDLAAALYLTIE